MKKKFYLLFILIGSLFHFSIFACTSFSLSDHSTKIVGKSFDWYQDYANIYSNLRGQEKVAFVADPRFAPTSWKSRFGSLTMNQYGRELPLGGINESGLVIEGLWLNNSGYPAITNEETLNELQWVQYQLDLSETVSEVVESFKRLKIASAYANLHYFVCDATGDCAIIEFIDGKVVIHRESEFPVITNNTFEKSLEYLKQFVDFGGTKKVRSSRWSLDRFVRASVGVKNFIPGEDDIGYAFKVLDSVSQKSLFSTSQLNTVYDQLGKVFYFRSRQFSEIKKMDLSDFNFSCKAPALVLAVNQNLPKEVSKNFVPYTREINKELIDKSFKRIARYFPKGSIERLITYPESFVCKE